jgi:hypothetical protein
MATCHEQADGRGYGLRSRVWRKQQKARLERRRAKRDPECMPGYGRYRGWLL